MLSIISSWGITVHVCVCVHVSIYRCVCTCVHVCVHVHMYVLCAFMSVGLSVCVCILQWIVIATFPGLLGISSVCFIVFVIFSLCFAL